MNDVKTCFSQGKFPWKGETGFQHMLRIDNIDELKIFLDQVHIRCCLLAPFFEMKDYPLVESRMLLPSFEIDTYEYPNLPGFSMLALDRPLHSFNELFQYDSLFSLGDEYRTDEQNSTLENQIFQSNTLAFLSRLPRLSHEMFRNKYSRVDTTLLNFYPMLMPLILEMDRAHVLSKSKSGNFQLSGIFASFPSDVDGELKRYGLRIGKFQPADSDLYLRNRLFTLQFLMELYGFPIASERRTSAALFARRLHKIGEKFLIRVLGQSDRTLTTIWNDGTSGQYPYVEKIALMRIDADQLETIQELKALKAFVDEKKRVVIVRVKYQQHAYSPMNVRQDRALSVATQAIIHPITGKDINHINILRDISSLLLCLNDIARGEYSGRTVYKRTEIIENSDSEEKRLKLFYAWLIKHQRRIIGYSDESYGNFKRILDHYLENVVYIDNSNGLFPLKLELQTRVAYIDQARTLRFLEEIKSRNYRGENLSYEAMLSEAVHLLRDFKFELATYFDDLMTTAITITEYMLNDRYLQRNYIEKSELLLTPKGLEIRKKYRALVQLHDELKAIQKNHK